MKYLGIKTFFALVCAVGLFYLIFQILPNLISADNTEIVMFGLVVIILLISFAVQFIYRLFKKKKL